MIEDGTVECYKGTDAKLINTLGPGDMFGELQWDIQHGEA